MKKLLAILALGFLASCGDTDEGETDSFFEDADVYPRAGLYTRYSIEIENSEGEKIIFPIDFDQNSKCFMLIREDQYMFGSGTCTSSSFGARIISNDVLFKLYNEGKTVRYTKISGETSYDYLAADVPAKKLLFVASAEPYIVAQPNGFSQDTEGILSVVGGASEKVILKNVFKMVVN